MAGDLACRLGQPRPFDLASYLAVWMKPDGCRDCWPNPTAAANGNVLTVISVRRS